MWCGEKMLMPAYFGEVAESCRLDECLVRACEMIGWKEKYPARDMGNGKVRAVGVGMAMQGSCISNVDVGSATIMLNEDGTYKLAIAAADMGTGCDTDSGPDGGGMSACDHRRDLRLRRGHRQLPL